MKNLFCLAGVVFAGKAADLHLLARGGVAVAAFCAMSSAVYVLNDLMDRERDAAHPEKCKRPIASGAVSPKTAWILGLAMLTFGMAASLRLGAGVAVITTAYFIVNIAYSVSLKHVVIVDVLVVSAGFLLRIFAGAEAVNVPVSAWILLCTFFLALFLGFAKRRAEMSVMRANPTKTRLVLAKYSEASLDTFTSMCATLSIATYALFTLSEGHDRSLVITTPPVAFAIFRYLLRCKEGAGESTDELLVHDRSLHLAITAWLGLYIWVLYGGLRLNLQ